MKILVEKIIRTLTEAIDQVLNTTYLLLDERDNDRYNEVFSQLNNLYCYLESQREMYNKTLLSIKK